MNLIIALYYILVLKLPGAVGLLGLVDDAFDDDDDSLKRNIGISC